MKLGSLRHPEILFKSCSPNKVEIGLRIPKDLSYLEGHFPSFPVVPGIVQLHWAVEFSREVFKIFGPISSGEKIKFNTLMRPMDEPRLLLEHFSEKSLVVYHYKSDEKMYASGRLIYALEG
jgi:3-hydroxymyristoyl/3-hydroxydecanoyl-(acyl carrier protein) dehydratase